MALITDNPYLLHSLRLHHLRSTPPADPHSPRIISLSPLTVSSNPYVRSSGLADAQTWPEVPRGLESPGLRAVGRGREEPSRRYAGLNGGGGAQPSANGNGSANENGVTMRRAQTQTQAQAVEEGKDPTVTLKYSATIGKPSSLYNPGLRLSNRDAQSSSTTSTTTAPNPARIPSAPRDRLRSSTFSTSPSSPSTPDRTPTIPTRLSTIPTHPSPLNPSSPPPQTSPPLPLPLRQSSTGQGRPRADSAPVLVLTSPGGRGTASPTRLEPVSPGAGAQAFAALGMGMTGRRGSNSTGTGTVADGYEYGTSFYEPGVPGRGGAADAMGGFGSILERAMSESEATAETGTGTSFDGDGGGRLSIEGGLGLGSRSGDGDGRGSGAASTLGGVARSMGMSLGMEGDLGSDEEELMDPAEEGDEEEEDEEEFLDAEDGAVAGAAAGQDRKASLVPGSRRGSRIPIPASEISFPQLPIPIPATDPKSPTPPSGLSLLFNPPTSSPLLASSSLSSSTTNPFLTLYSSVPPAPSTPSSAYLTLTIFFPFSSAPGEPLEVRVRKEVSVEEVLGWGLGRYWEEGREPSLGSEWEGDKEGGREREIRASTVGWGLRIAEDDGEVDEDFPPLDREGQIGKFNFEAFAIVEATPAQIRANLTKQPLRPLPPSQTPSQRSLRTPVVGSTSVSMSKGPGSTSSFESSAPTMPSQKQVAGVGGMMVLLRVRVTSSADVHFTTTINVPSEMYFADIIDLLISKKRLTPSNPSQWVLLLGDASMALPLDRTVESLMGAADLALVRRAWAENHRLVARGKEGEMRGGDPNASIFKKRLSEPAVRMGGGPMMDFTSTYKKYLVQRKMPIGRHERILAIDGDYIHIMPSENKTFFDSMKTTSFHVTSITSCKQASKAPATFKIDVWREGGDKRYEIEAETAKQALEIVTAIRNLMKLYQSERKNALPGKARVRG